MTVAADAVQQVDGQSVVFIAVPGGFAVQPVKTGRAGGRLVEVTEGLQAAARATPRQQLHPQVRAGQSQRRA